jgi:hypothetical protein
MTMHKFHRLLKPGVLAGLLVMLSLAACKKDKQPVKPVLPVFGTCKSVASSGRLSFSDPAGPYTYQTSGGGKIVIDLNSIITISHADYPGFKIEFWGVATVNGKTNLSGSHESLNYKHIKDRFSARRTINFPDGAKFTFVTDGLQGPILSISIYDGAACYHINPVCKTLEYSGSSAEITKQLDDLEPDGEAAAFEFTATGLLYLNTYTEEASGNKIPQRIPLGELNRAEPTQVKDYFDDPRLAAT